MLNQINIDANHKITLNVPVPIFIILDIIYTPVSLPLRYHIDKR